MLLLLLSVTAAVVVAVIMTRRRAQVTKPGVEGINQYEVNKKLMENAEELGISPEDLDKALDEELRKDKEKSCNVSPLPNGLCGSGFTLENDCCYPLNKERNKRNEQIELAKNITKTLVIAVGAGMVMENALIKAAGGKRAVVTGATRGAQTGVTVGTKTAAGAAKTSRSAAAGARAAAAAAKAGRAVATAATKVAAASSKWAMAACGGPVGLMVAGAMLVFDAISLTLDLLDVDGYDSYTPQAVLTKIRNLIDYNVHKEFEKAGVEYPMLFPLSTVFPEEMGIAQEYMSGYIMDKYATSELVKYPRAQAAFDKFVQDVIDKPDEEVPVPKEYIDFIVELYRIKHVERDRAIYSKMKELLGDQAWQIELYEPLSGPDRMSVTFSREGAKEWNSRHEAVWLSNNDLFKPPERDTIKVPDQAAACYTDTYYLYDSGSSDDPNMAPKKLPVKTVLANYYGSLLAYCEKVRKMKGTSTGVDPKGLGTRFNFDTGVCEFSKELCRRYGLEFKDNDCKLKPGQDVAEIIFGTTITRAMIKEWDQRIDDFNSGDPGKIAVALLKTQFDMVTFGLGTMTISEAAKSYAKKSRPATVGDCPSGMRDDGVNCWLDPVYRGPGKPLGCKDDEEKKGQLCYPKCRKDYESKNLECEGKCPPGSENTGLTCLQSIHAYIPGNKCSNPFRKCFYERKPCRDGYRYRGTTCNKECLPGFTFRSGAAGSAFCDKPRNRYSRAGQAKPLSMSSCPEGYERQGLLCYKKCSNKGPEGQYKYNAVLDWCQPEGGAGIKKGLDDRMKCPEGMERKGPLCYEPCKEGERDDGLFCKRMD